VKAEPFDLLSVATAIAFIESDEVTRTRTPRGGSYALKHCAERWGRRIGFAPYVGNGDFILAALHCGVRLGKPFGSNCLVSLSMDDCRGGDQGIF
jgi:hypothetical protein